MSGRCPVTWCSTSPRSTRAGTGATDTTERARFPARLAPDRTPGRAPDRSHLRDRAGAKSARHGREVAAGQDGGHPFHSRTPGHAGARLCHGHVPWEDRGAVTGSATRAGPGRPKKPPPRSPNVERGGSLLGEASAVSGAAPKDLRTRSPKLVDSDARVAGRIRGIRGNRRMVFRHPSRAPGPGRRHRPARPAHESAGSRAVPGVSSPHCWAASACWPETDASNEGLHERSAP